MMIISHLILEVNKGSLMKLKHSPECFFLGGAMNPWTIIGWIILASIALMALILVIAVIKDAIYNHQLMKCIKNK